MDTLCTAVAAPSPMDVASWACLWLMLFGAMTSAVGLVFLARWTNGALRHGAAACSLAIALGTGGVALTATATPMPAPPRPAAASARALPIADPAPSSAVGLSPAATRGKLTGTRGEHVGPKSRAVRDGSGRYLDLPKALQEEDHRNLPPPLRV